jgi:hypothetical protein
LQVFNHNEQPADQDRYHDRNIELHPLDPEQNKAIDEGQNRDRRQAKY